ncbi:unnamed protein product [Arctogadus glacialis]
MVMSAIVTRLEESCNVDFPWKGVVGFVWSPSTEMRANGDVPKGGGNGKKECTVGPASGGTDKDRLGAGLWW